MRMATRIQRRCPMWADSASSNFVRRFYRIRLGLWQRDRRDASRRATDHSRALRAIMSQTANRKTQNANADLLCNR
jgi:hypothetical protein